MTQPAPEPSEGAEPIGSEAQRSARVGLAWAVWLQRAMERAGLVGAQLVQRAGGRFTSQELSGWSGAFAVPSPQVALFVAEILSASGPEALAAAGYGALVDQIRAGLQGDNPIGYGGAMTDPGAFEPTLDGLLAAIAGLGERMDRGFASVNAKISNVYEQIDHANADLEVLTTQGRTQAAQLAGLREEIRGDILAAEARTAARLDDLRQVMLGAKADIARHAGDPEAHPHRHVA